MTGEGTISFYSLEIKQTGDGGSGPGLRSDLGQDDDSAAGIQHHHRFQAVENIWIEVSPT